MQIKKKAKNFWNDQASKNDEGSSINQESLRKDGTKNVANDKKIVNNKEIQSYNCKKKWEHYASECKSKKVPKKKRR